MRYLTPGFAVGALRRGRSTEQFLGGIDTDGVAGVRWAEIRPTHRGYDLFAFEVKDLDYEAYSREGCAVEV